jgi:threonine dehydratase
MIPYSWIEQASERIRPYIHKTPLTYDAEHQIYLKWENHQATGSFKARGALNKILALQDWEIMQGLVTASAGNHGQGVALAAKLRQASVTIFASEHALPNKVRAMQVLGATVHLVDGGYGEAEKAGIAYALESGATWVSPYNDGMIIAGQGTLAMEILQDHPEPSPLTWFVPAGGGGLVSGIGCVLQMQQPATNLVAVQSVASPFLYELYHHNTQKGVDELPSLADGLAGPVEEGSVTIPIVKNVVADFILVTETEIRDAVRYAWNTYHERIEGSGAASLAAVLSQKVSSRPALVVITGGNIEPDDFTKIISGSGTVLIE